MGVDATAVVEVRTIPGWCDVSTVLADPARLAAVDQLGLDTPTARRGAGDTCFDAVRETPVRASFCQYVVGTGQPFVVNDSSRNPLACDNPAVRTLRIAAYCGVQLRLAEGNVVGGRTPPITSGDLPPLIETVSIRGGRSGGDYARDRLHCGRSGSVPLQTECLMDATRSPKYSLHAQTARHNPIPMVGGVESDRGMWGLQPLDAGADTFGLGGDRHHTADGTGARVSGGDRPD